MKERQQFRLIGMERGFTGNSWMKTSAWRESGRSVFNAVCGILSALA
jgi:hypothetical protein